MIFLQFKYNHIAHLLKSLQGFIIFNIKSKVPSVDSRPFLIFSEPPLYPNQCFLKCGVVLTSIRHSCILVKNDNDSPTRTNWDLRSNARASAFYTSAQHFSNFYTGIREALIKTLSHIYPILYTDYLFVFSRSHFGIFCVFGLIRLF